MPKKTKKELIDALCVERIELARKIHAAESAVKNFNLDAVSEKLLVAQIGAMKSYLSILELRIDFAE